jgi:hypothetical protein
MGELERNPEGSWIFVLSIVIAFSSLAYMFS